MGPPEHGHVIREYYWRGKGPLWEIYWLCGVLLSGAYSRYCENIEGRPFGYDPAMWTSLARSLTVARAINGLALSILLIQMSATNWG